MKYLALLLIPLFFSCSSIEPRDGNFFYVTVYYYTEGRIDRVEVSELFESELSTDQLEAYIDISLPTVDLEFVVVPFKHNVRAYYSRENTISNWSKMGHRVESFKVNTNEI